MASKVRRVSAEVALVLGCLVGAADTAAQENAAPVMTVVVRGQHLVASDVLQQSMSVVSRIYRQIGVEVTWLHPDGFAASMPGDTENRLRYCRRVILVTLDHREPVGDLAHRPAVLGMAAVGGRFAYVFLGRVNAVAAKRRTDAGDLLGHVMAHEIGHLLLPRHSHSSRGLMRSELDLDLVEKHLLEFERAQGALIRARVTAEMQIVAVH